MEYKEIKITEDRFNDLVAHEKQATNIFEAIVRGFAKEYIIENSLPKPEFGEQQQCVFRGCLQTKINT